jgi:hypothetical protein
MKQLAGSTHPETGLSPIHTKGTWRQTGYLMVSVQEKDTNYNSLESLSSVDFNTINGIGW